MTFFLILGTFILIFAQEFVADNLSASIAIICVCFIMAILFCLKNVLFINIILAFYIFQNYLTKPFISIFEDSLSLENLSYIRDYSAYFNPNAASVVYWSIFSLLFAWLMGILLSKDLHGYKLHLVPKIFTKIDRVILKGGLPFWFALGLLIILNYRSPESGLRSTVEVSDRPLFLWGMASLATINIVCLYTFLKCRHAGMKPAHFSLLMVPMVTVLIGVLSGSRSAVSTFLLLGFIYWLYLNIQKKWKLHSLLKGLFVSSILLSVALLIGLFAQALRPLYRYSESVGAMEILGVLNFESIVLDNENLVFGITQIMHRLSALKAQFYILNDWYIHEPWQHYNPLMTMMRVVNDMVPGDVFDGMLTINQLFDYIYHDTILIYSSEMWSIEGTLYLYFGHFIAPIVVFFIAVLANYLYSSIEKSVIASPTSAAFIIILLSDTIVNGTAERVIITDIVRPISSFVIFLFLYKVFLLFLPMHIVPLKNVNSYTEYEQNEDTKLP